MQIEPTAPIPFIQLRRQHVLRKFCSAPNFVLLHVPPPVREFPTRTDACHAKFLLCATFFSRLTSDERGAGGAARARVWWTSPRMMSSATVHVASVQSDTLTRLLLLARVERVNRECLRDH